MAAGKGTVLRQLLVSLGLDVDQASFQEGRLVVDGLKMAAKELVSAAREAVVGMVELIKETAAYGKETIETAQMTGLSTQALQEWRRAADYSGVGAEQLDVGIFHLARSMASAKKGSEDQAAAFHKLGVKLTDAHGKLRSTDDVLTDLTVAFSKLPDGLDKTNLAMEIFGRSGARMIPLLDQGAEGLAELRKNAFVMTPEQLNDARDLVITQMQLEATTRNLWRGAIAPLLREVNELLKRYLAWKKANGEIMKQRITAVLHGIIVAGRGVAEVFALLGRNADVIAIALGALALGFAILKREAIMAALATAEAWMAAAAPFILMGTAIAAALLLFDDVRMYAKYGDKAHTITGQFVKQLKEWAKPGGDMEPMWLKWIREFVAKLAEAIELIHQLQAPEPIKGGGGASPIGREMKIGKLGGYATEKAIDALGLRPDFVKRADARGDKAYGDTGSYFEGLRATFGLGPYGDYEAPPAYAPQGGGGGNYVEIKRGDTYFQIQQAPGQSPEDLVRLIDQRHQELRDSDNEAAAAALGH